jgi:hypothetical protein
MLKRATPRRFRRRPTPDLAGTDPTAADSSARRDRALAHESAGRMRDAISEWTALNRIEADPWIESHLVDLRCDPRTIAADYDADAGLPADQWPRQLADPFPDITDRPPEIQADQLTMEVLGGAILHHGCLLVRGLFSRERADELRATIDQAFAGRQQHVAGVPSDRTTPWYVPCGPWDAAEPKAANGVRNYNDTCKAVHVADSPRALFQVFEALASTNVVSVINEYLGERALLSVRKTMIRRVPPDAKPAFHQDGTFMGVDTRAVDIWVALTECGDGTDAPGLSVLPKRLNGSARPDAVGPLVPLNPAELAEVADGTPVVRPHCQPGDALLFDELCLHANGGDRPGLARDRYALEAWMFAPSGKPGHYIPILV